MSTDPKSFFREMDALLAAIRIDKTDGSFIEYIMSELEQRFGKKLKISHGRIYEMRGADFVLIQPAKPQLQTPYAKSIAISDEVIQLVSVNRSYIYDDQRFNRVFLNPESGETETPAAVWVHSPEQQWLLVFRLSDSWTREEISLFLNAVRLASNYRLFTDSITNTIEQSIQIQKSLLPKKPLVIDGFDIAGQSNPAEYVGGDFYDYFSLDDGTFGVSFGDASGHGLPAALLVRDVVIGLRMGLAKEQRLVHTIKKLNQVIQQSTYSTNFVSLFVGEIEPDGHIFYANAGHPSPFIIADEGDQALPATGITLGFMKEIELHRAHAYLPKGGIMVIYSDGVIERENEAHEQFGMDRLKTLITGHKDETARQLVDLILQTVFEFGNRKNWQDDTTLVIVKRLQN